MRLCCRIRDSPDRWLGAYIRMQFFFAYVRYYQDPTISRQISAAQFQFIDRIEVTGVKGYRFRLWTEVWVKWLPCVISDFVRLNCCHTQKLWTNTLAQEHTPATSYSHPPPFPRSSRKNVLYARSLVVSFPFYRRATPTSAGHLPVFYRLFSTARIPQHFTAGETHTSSPGTEKLFFFSFCLRAPVVI